MRRVKKEKLGLVEVHARLFPDDVETLKKLAEERRTPWQILLRTTLHRALSAERRELMLLKE